MNRSEEFYTTKLYPFQDGILSIVKDSGIPFYLTGGTALSRFYYQHRYSDDLDFFVNDDIGFREYFRDVYNVLDAENDFAIDSFSVINRERFGQIHVEKNNISLKLDFVNDIAYRVGSPFRVQEGFLIDTWENILSNKLSAIFRYEPKDLADIWAISSHEPVDWKKAFTDTKMKDAGINEVQIAEICMTVPKEELNRVLWSKSINIDSVKNDLFEIGRKIILLDEEKKDT